MTPAQRSFFMSALTCRSNLAPAPEYYFHGDDITGTTNVVTWPARVGSCTLVPNTLGAGSTAMLIDTTTVSGHKLAKATANSTYKQLRAPASVSAYHNTGNFTSIVYTYKPTGATQSSVQVAWGRATASDNGSRYLRVWDATATARYSVYSTSDGGSLETDSLTSQTFPLDTKFFMTHTWNGSTVTFYRDLTSLGTATHTTSIGTSADSLLIGGNPAATYCAKDTWVLAWQLFPRVLSFAEITSAQASIAASFV